MSYELDGTTFNPLHRPCAPQCTASQIDGQTTVYDTSSWS